MLPLFLVFLFVLIAQTWHCKLQNAANPSRSCIVEIWFKFRKKSALYFSPFYIILEYWTSKWLTQEKTNFVLQSLLLKRKMQNRQKKLKGHAFLPIITPLQTRMTPLKKELALLKSMIICKWFVLNNCVVMQNQS